MLLLFDWSCDTRDVVDMHDMLKIEQICDTLSIILSLITYFSSEYPF